MGEDKLWYMKFEVSPFLRDTAGLTAASTGIWSKMLCLMHTNDPRGYMTGTPESISRKCGCSIEEFERFVGENEIESFCDVTESHGVFTFMSRRMLREEAKKKEEEGKVEKEREQAAKRKRKQRAKDVSHECHGDVTDESRDVTPPSLTSNKLLVNNKKDISSDRGSDEPPFPPDSWPVKLTDQLEAGLYEIKPDRTDIKGKSWRPRSEQAFDLMLRIDKRPPERAEVVVDWALHDDFWMKNIRSGGAVRKHFDQLEQFMGPQSPVIDVGEFRRLKAEGKIHKDENGEWVKDD